MTMIPQALHQHWTAISPLLSVRNEDEYATFNTGFIVYHDDLGDYSTNEPTMDGTASAVWLLAALAPRR